jgi:hypothetical protein
MFSVQNKKITFLEIKASFSLSKKRFLLINIFNSK